jgi:hypothetical protein
VATPLRLFSLCWGLLEARIDAQGLRGNVLVASVRDHFLCVAFGCGRAAYLLSGIFKTKESGKDNQSSFQTRARTQMLQALSFWGQPLADSGLQSARFPVAIFSYLLAGSDLVSTLGLFKKTSINSFIIIAFIPIITVFKQARVINTSVEQLRNR